MTTDFLRSAARFVFFAALIIAPWAYGGTTASSILVINWLLGAALVLWVVELIVDRRWPRVPKLLLALILTLLAIGIWMTLNARAVFDADYGVFAPIKNFLPQAPGSIDAAISLAWMLRAGLLLVSVIFVIDLVSDDAALLHLWYIVGIVVGSICLLGLLEKASGAEMIFWQAPPEAGKPVLTFFGTYYYHANAGAFINLGLPITAGLAVRALTATTSPAILSIWLTVFVLNLGAVAANTSRMAQLIGVGLFLAFCIHLAPRLVRGVSRVRLNIALTGIAALFVLLYAVAQASHLEQPLKRWETSEQIPDDARWRAAAVAQSALPEIGALGFGPGVFRVAFPIYNERSSESVSGNWRFLHQDCLQTLIEWGWIGTALWTLLFFGGIVVALLELRKQRSLKRAPLQPSISDLPQVHVWLPRRRLLVSLVVIALAGVAVHAQVDFPLQIYSIQLYVATYFGICWSTAARSKEQRASK